MVVTIGFPFSLKLQKFLRLNSINKSLSSSTLSILNSGEPTSWSTSSSKTTSTWFSLETPLTWATLCLKLIRATLPCSTRSTGLYYQLTLLWSLEFRTMLRASTTFPRLCSFNIKRIRMELILKSVTLIQTTNTILPTFFTSKLLMYSLIVNPILSTQPPTLTSRFLLTLKPQSDSSSVNKITTW